MIEAVADIVIGPDGSDVYVPMAKCLKIGPAGGFPVQWSRSVPRLASHHVQKLELILGELYIIS